MTGKVAFVTGASRVTGKAIALELARAGYDVGITYMGYKEGADDAVRQMEEMGRKGKAYYADTGDVAATQVMLVGFFEDFGHIDVMVCNTGITKYVDFLSASQEVYDYIFNTNIRGSYFCGQSAARNMVKNGVKGVIVNISSIHAKSLWPGDTLYATTKAALCRLTEAQALELAPHGIRAVGVAPGCVYMGGYDDTQARKARYDWVNSKIPMKRHVSAEEIGQAVVYLASEKASYITGQTLFIEGGLMLPVLVNEQYNSYNA